MFKSVIATIGCAILPFVAMADESASQSPAMTAPELALLDVLADMPDGDKVTAIVHEKMNPDYLREALVILGDDCDAEGCRWMLFSEFLEDGWRAIGQGRAHDVVFIEAGEGHILSVDGVRWEYKGGQEIRIADGLFSGRKPVMASAEIIARLAEAGFDQADKMRAEVYRGDVDGDGRPDDLVMIGGAWYAAGSSGSPYVIFDADGELILSSITQDLPKIFPWGSGTIVVDVVPAGLQVHPIERDEP